MPSTRIPANDSLLLRYHRLTKHLKHTNPIPFPDSLPDHRESSLERRATLNETNAFCWALTNRYVPGHLTHLQVGRLFESYQKQKADLIKKGEWTPEEEAKLDKTYSLRVKDRKYRYQRSTEYKDIVQQVLADQKHAKASLEPQVNDVGNSRASTNDPVEMKDLEVPLAQGNYEMIDSAQYPLQNVAPIEIDSQSQRIKTLVASWTDEDFINFLKQYL